MCLYRKSAQIFTCFECHVDIVGWSCVLIRVYACTHAGPGKRKLDRMSVLVYIIKRREERGGQGGKEGIIRKNRKKRSNERWKKSIDMN